jgi:cytochrome c2
VRLDQITIVVATCFYIVGCNRPENAGVDARTVPGGDAARGRALVASGVHGCQACHAIPGVRPRGVVGPPLDGMAGRIFIAGTLANTPNVLVEFLENPPALVPRTAMPDVELTTTQARDIAAFLYTLEPSRAP